MRIRICELVRPLHRSPFSSAVNIPFFDPKHRNPVLPAKCAVVLPGLIPQTALKNRGTASTSVTV